MEPLLRVAGITLVSCAAFLFSHPGYAAAQARLQVSATVQAMASLTLTAQPTGLLVTPQDIRRGYVTVTQPTLLVLKSNSAQGVSFDVAATLTLFSAVRIHGLDGDATLGGEGGSLTHRWVRPQPLPLTLTFTFILKPDAPAGRYPWPLAFSVRALETL